ncbi:MAG: hypothetical protein ACK4F9_06000 [Brevinematia bacterium]
MAYITVMKIYDMLERAIHYKLKEKSQDLYGEIEVDESYFVIK